MEEQEQSWAEKMGYPPPPKPLEKTIAYIIVMLLFCLILVVLFMTIGVYAILFPCATFVAVGFFLSTL